MQNHLEFLRIRSHKHEIMVSPSEYTLLLQLYIAEMHITASPFSCAGAEFTLIVVQTPSTESS